jgi:hypothetical protein
MRVGRPAVWYLTFCPDGDETADPSESRGAERALLS